MPARLPSSRDDRIDFLRGFALLSIFIDHVPGNFLGTLTMRSFGFADAAELFVLLAGLSSMLAYGKRFREDGAVVGIRRVVGRCLRIYLFQVGLLLATLAILRTWLGYFGLEPHNIAPMLNGGLHAVGQGLVLHALPANLNILPLYIVLLALFPLLYLGSRLSVVGTLIVSGGFWVAANLDRNLNLPNWMDGQGWFFNPVAWQFLFAIGMLSARFFVRGGQGLPRRRWAMALCAFYLLFALVASAPWTNWGVNWKPLDIGTDKTALSPLRLINIVALVYLLMTVNWFRRLVDARALGFVGLCGRHSLEVFSAVTLLSLFGRLLFRTFGVTWATQSMINIVGFGCIIALAWWLDNAGSASAASRKARSDPGKTPATS